VKLRENIIVLKMTKNSKNQLDLFIPTPQTQKGSLLAGDVLHDGQDSLCKICHNYFTDRSQKQDICMSCSYEMEYPEE